MPGALRLMLAACAAPENPLGARDRAMLLLGFGAALRRSELVGLAMGDISAVPGRGLVLTIRRSKTDQQGRGQQVAVWANPAEPAFCPATALDAWLGFRGRAPDLRGGSSDAERPLFCGLTKAGRLTGTGLSDKAVVRLIKQAAEAAGLDPVLYSGHSLRARPAHRRGGEPGAARRTDAPVAPSRGAERAGLYRPVDLWRNNVTERVFAAAAASDAGQGRGTEQTYADPA